MGFGWLLIGYFFTFFLEISTFGVYTAPIGYAVIWWGLSRLQLYCHRFRFAKYTLIPMMLVALYRFAVVLLQSFSLSIPSLEVSLPINYILNYTQLCLSLIFHTLLAVAIMEICKRTGVLKNAMFAMRNLLFVYLGTFAHLVNLLTMTLSPILYLVMVGTHLVWSICNLVLLYSCYARICPAGQENYVKESTPSRFAFVNRLREDYRKSEDRAIRRESDYRAQMFRKNMEKQQTKHEATGARQKKREELQSAKEASRRNRRE